MFENHSKEFREFRRFREFEELAYLGPYGAHMFALRVWVGDGTSKTIEKGSFKIK